LEPQRQRSVKKRLGQATKQREPVVSDTSNVTTLALLNLIRLLAAEMVAGEHRDDVTKLVQAMDRQLDATPLPRGIDINDARSGIAEARKLLRPHLTRVRDLAQAVRARDHAEAASIGGDAIPLSRPPKYLQ
jgi:hypothetical protein